MLLHFENPDQYKVEKDILLNEKEMRDKIKYHKNAIKYMNNEHFPTDIQKNVANRRFPSQIEQAFI